MLLLSNIFWIISSAAYFLSQFYFYQNNFFQIPVNINLVILVWVLSLGIQQITFLWAHWQFSLTYWQVSLKMPTLINNEPPARINKKLVSIMKYTFITLIVMSPVIAQFYDFKVYSLLVDPNYQANILTPSFQDNLLSDYNIFFGMMNVQYLIAFVTMVLFIDSLQRIYRSLKEKQAFIVSSWMIIIHLICYILYISTILILDTQQFLVVMNNTLSAQDTAFTLQVIFVVTLTNFLSQIFFNQILYSHSESMYRLVVE